MADQKFSINSRFRVDPVLNLINDEETGKEHRLEPRLMAVLTLLAKHEGQLVRREMLISEIWNDYGGAEDSLNQAISFLRKTLQDTKKELIETVPKKGYILHATISKSEIVEVTTRQNFLFKYATSIAIGILAFLVGGYFLLKSQTNNDDKVNLSQAGFQKRMHTNDPLEVDFSVLNIPEEENSLNTVTTTGPDGTKYRVVSVGDKRPKFYVNGRLISEQELENYSELESRMLQQLWERQRKSVDTSR